MSETGIIIIIATAYYALGFAYRRFRTEFGAHRAQFGIYHEDVKLLTEYTIKHDYDLRANEIVQKYRPIMQNFKGRRGSAEWENILCEMFYEMVEPFKECMTKEELKGFQEKDWNVLNSMVGQCLCVSPRFKGYNF